MTHDSTAQPTVRTAKPPFMSPLVLAHLLLVAASLLLVQGCATPGNVTPPGVVTRGKIDHRQFPVVREQADFEVTLAPAVDGCVRLRFTRITLTTVKEWIYCEKWIFYGDPDEKDPSKIRRKFVPGEYIEVPGEEKVKRETAGPLAGETVGVAGVTARTDADGVFRDTEEVILGLFDRQKPFVNVEVTLRVHHPTLGEKTLTITRPQLLEALGCPQDEPPLASDEGLQAHVALDPATPRPGDIVRITLSVENKGQKHIAQVIGRTFSRHSWLNGRNFYIGTLAPQGKRVFVRIVQVPATLGSADVAVFASMGVWNRSGKTVTVAIPAIQLAPAPSKP